MDSINVFKLIYGIFARNRNNPVHNFERASEMETWLREQWSGLFRELLRTRSQQKQLSALNAQVTQLQSVNDTLKNYLEAVLGKVSPESETLIKSEHRKLENERVSSLLSANNFYAYLTSMFNLDNEVVRRIIEEPNTAVEAIDMLQTELAKKNNFSPVLIESRGAQRDYNRARKVVGKPAIEFHHDLAETEATLSDVARPGRRSRNTKPSSDDAD